MLFPFLHKCTTIIVSNEYFHTYESSYCFLGKKEFVLRKIVAKYQFIENAMGKPRWIHSIGQTPPIKTMHTADTVNIVHFLR